MSLKIKYTPLYGVGPDDPVCGLLELDGARLLLDCGCSPNPDSRQLDTLARAVADVDAILITHGTFSHMGALPMLVAKGALPPETPILSTLPVKTLGGFMLHEYLTDRRACSDYDAYTASHITELCEARPWHLARFQQRLELTGRAEGMSATPYGAGHTLGGAVWRILTRDGQEVVYCAEWCHRKERHLAACQLPELFDRPAALVIGAKGALSAPLPTHERDAELLDVILSTLRETDGCVLIPVETTTRLLELALLLDEFWAREKFDRVYPLLLVSSVGRAVSEAAQSMLEYMSDSVGKAFELHRNNPFNFKCIRILRDLTQLSQQQAGPKVVLAGRVSLERGPARQLLIDWAGDEKNTVCFVQKPREGTLAHTLLSFPFPEDKALQITVQQSRRVPLEGAELEAWLAGQQPSDAPSAMDTDTPHKTDKADNNTASNTDNNNAASNTAAGDRAAQNGAGPSNAPAPPATPFSATPAKPLLSVFSGTTPMRTNSAQLSVLVRGPTGQLEQQLQQQSSHSQLVPAAAAGTQHGAQGGGAGGAGRALMDGCEAPQGAAYPMFPDEDEGVCTEVWDEYGVVIDRARFQAAQLLSTVPIGSTWRTRRTGSSRGRLRGGVDVKQEDMDEDVKPEINNTGGPQEDSESESEEEEDRPTKLVTETVELTVRAAIRYFNFDGLPDARITQKALTEVCPQSLVVLHGCPEERRELMAVASRDLQGFRTRAYSPESEEPVNISLPLCHTLYLSQALRAAFPLHPLGASGHLGAVVDALVTAPDPHFPELLQLVPRPPGMQSARTLSNALSGIMVADQLTGSADAAAGLLERAQSDMAGGVAAGWAGDVFFADGSEGVRLSELKKALAEAGIQSQLAAGVLSCGPVVISKASVYQSSRAARVAADADVAEDDWTGRGHLVIESALTDRDDALLQRIRQVILTQFGAEA